MQPDNPFQSPQTVADKPRLSAETKYARVGKVVVTWEKLRILYNGVLVAIVVLVFAGGTVAGRVTDDSFSVWEFAEMLIVGCLTANVAFCAGPAVDGYLSWFGLRHPAVTLVLFLVGTAVAGLLATGSMFYFVFGGESI